MNGTVMKYMGPIVVGVLVLIIVGIGAQFMDRGTTITVLEAKVVTLEKSMEKLEAGFREVDREHEAIQLNKLRLSNLEALHR